MKKIIFTTAFILAALSINAQTMKTIRMIYPQWQGASISAWIPEVKNPDDASRGYYLGAQMLDFLAPKNPQQKAITVPVSQEVGDRTPVEGVIDRDVIAKQTKTGCGYARRGAA